MPYESAAVSFAMSTRAFAGSKLNAWITASTMKYPLAFGCDGTACFPFVWVLMCSPGRRGSTVEAPRRSAGHRVDPGAHERLPIAVARPDSACADPRDRPGRTL